jgi:hypothetical protein
VTGGVFDNYAILAENSASSESIDGNHLAKMAVDSMSSTYWQSEDDIAK